jgi:hypothetical protein
MSGQIRQLAERYLNNVKEAGGGNLRASCPFHTSASSRRSLYIFAQTGSWTCFGCDAGGSLPWLLYKLGLPRSKVDEILKGINIEWETTTKSRLHERRKGWDTLPEWVLGAYDWLPNRMLWWGFDENVLQDFGIGYDKTHSRITFPIRDYLGRLACISGRAEPGGFPRYKVYDASEPLEGRRPGELHGAVAPDYLPDNRMHLYGFDRCYAHRFFRERETLPPLILVEGYKGVLWMHQHGFKHTAGLQGSSMTKQQEITAGMVRGPYYIFLDNEPGKAFPDNEGRCSAYRITERMSRYGKALVCQYPEGMPIGTSPDDLKPDELQAMIDSAKSTAHATLDQAPKGGWRRTAQPRRGNKP